MANILEEVLKFIPKDVKITNTAFEGANIVIYTKNKDFFLIDNGVIKDIVDSIKKRVELRPDPSITMELEKTETMIRKIIPKEAKIGNVIFDPQRSRVIIEAEKPGIAIGKSGEVLKEVKKKTLWVPMIRRTPAIRSKIIENIRQVLYENNDYRKKFLNDVGKKIYGDWSKEKKEEWIRISVLGGGRQVGRSCFLLQTPMSNVILDCGINIAANDQEAFPYLDANEFDISKLDAVICSHAHLDHSGFIPYLYKMGYKGPTYMTAPTRDISALLALDYIGVAYKEAKKSIFSSTDIKEMVKHTICLEYEEVTDITADIRLTLYNAGHTLGSCQVHLHIGNGLHNLVYTGDMKYAKTKILDSAITRFPRLETLMIESTYGAKEDVLPPIKVAEADLTNSIKETIERKGKVIIPVLGVGRAQEVMLLVENAMTKGELPQVPIYLDGMLWDVTAIHTAYPTFLNTDIKKRIFHRDQNPFLSDLFKRVGSQKERKEVLEGKPCIILATSGMMQGGASVQYFRELADNPKNKLLFVSYQARGSLGQRIQNGEKEMMMANGNKPEMIKVNIEVHTINGLSGHSGRNQLTSYVYHLDPKPKKVLVIHGESSKCVELASTIHKLNRVETIAPRNLEVVRLR